VATRAPDDNAAAERRGARPHVLDARVAPELDQPGRGKSVPEASDALAEEVSDVAPTRGDRPADSRKDRLDVGVPERARDPAWWDEELEHRDASAGFDDAGQLGERRAGVVDVAEEVGERQRVEARVREGKRLGPRLVEGDPLARTGGVGSCSAGGQHLGALVDTDHPAAIAADELERDGAGATGDVEHDVPWIRLDARDEERPPARVLPEAEETRVPVVRVRQRREKLARMPVALAERLGHAAIVARMSLDEELGRARDAAAGFAGEGEQVAGIVPTQPGEDGRVYLCAYRLGERQSWLALDDACAPVLERERVRDAVSIAALCELAEETAGSGDLTDLRARLAELRVTENPEGVEEAESAADALERTIEPLPRIASAGYLDAVGLAVTRLEQALGQVGGSPFVAAMKSGVGAADELADDVERTYKRPLS